MNFFKINFNKLLVLIIFIFALIIFNGFNLISSDAQKPNIKSDELNLTSFSSLKLDTSLKDPLYFETKNELSLPLKNNGFQKNDIFISPIYDTPFKANAIGAYWREDRPKDTYTKVSIKLETADGWRDWQEALVGDTNNGKEGTDGDKIFADLIFDDKIQAFQYKIELTTNDSFKTPTIKDINFNYIDSTTGPEVKSNSLINQAKASPQVTSRSDWGCPDPNNTMFQGDWKYWPADYRDYQKIIVHHTVNPNSSVDSNPQAVVRGIWQYHAVTRGWGDIGYNYLIDRQGRIYEGRFGGENVGGGHAYKFNLGSIGIGMLGTYSDVDMTDAARSTLTDFTGERSAYHNFDPRVSSSFLDQWVPNVGGHQEYRYYDSNCSGGICNATSCPGSGVMNNFGNIRYWSGVYYEKYRSALSLSSFSASPSNPAIGENVTVTFRVHNLLNKNITIESIGIASRLGSLNNDFGFSKNINFAIGESKEFSATAKFDKLGSYSNWISYKQDGSWRNTISDSGVSNGLTINTHVPNVKVIESLSLNPAYPLVGQSAQAQFKIHNYDSRPATINALGVAARFNGQNKDFAWKPITLAPGAEYTYTDSQTFSQTGSYSSWVSTLWPDNNWRGIGGQNAKSDLGFGVYQTPADPKISSSLSVSPKYPVIGQTVTASFKVKNFGDQPIKYQAIGVALRGPNNSNLNKDFTWRLEIIPGNTEVTLNYSKVITEAGNYSAYLSSYDGSSWNSSLPKTSDSVSLSSSFTVYQTAADPKIISSLNITPQDPVMGQAVTASFEIKNFGDQPIDFKSLGVAVRINNQPQDFAWNAYTLLGGEPKTITLTQNFNSAGNYSAWISAYWPAGYWSSFQTTGTHIQTSANFGVSDYFDKIRISSFSISPTNPVVGEEVTATVGVTNLSSANISINTFGVAVRINPKDGFLSKDFAYASLNLPANQPTTLTYKQAFNNWAYYESFVTYYQGGKWYYPMNNNSVPGMLSFTTHLPDVRITSNIVIDPVTPAMGQTMGGYFTVKNFDSRPITLTMGIASRYGNQNKDFEWKNITFQPGESKQYSSTRTADAVGNHWAWISARSPLGHWYTPPLSGASLSSTGFNVIGHLTTPVSVTGIGDYTIRDSNRNILKTLNIWNETFVSYSNGKYYVTAPNFATVSNSYIRLEPVGSTIMQINSYYDPNWNNTINYNRFRGTIEIKYSQISNALWAINDLPMEDYLKGMAEASPSSHLTHLKTMAVAERSYAYYHLVRGGKHPGEPFHLKNSRTVNGVKNGDDQVYAGYGIEEQSSTMKDAVNVTSQKVVTYNNTPVVTPYYSHSDGRTRSAQEKWGWNDTPWLVSVSDPDCNGMSLLGHGVGLSAYGALKRAERNENYENILQYYYQGTSLGTINNPGIKIGIHKVQY